MDFEHFFDYYYVGPPGDGMYGPRHFILMALTILLAFALYQYFKRHSKHARKVIVILSVLLLIDRLYKQINRVIEGIEDPALMALPWHLCTLMTFVMPIVVIFNIKKLKTVIYSLCMMGGIVSLILGGFFGSKYLKYEDVEGIFAHVLLIYVPLIEVAVGEFKLEFKNAWKTSVGLIICTLWALFADLVLFSKFRTNSSQLIDNNLGFDIPGIPFQVLVVVIAILFILVLYAVPSVYRKMINKNNPKVK